MAGVRFAELQSRPIEFLDFTSLTLDEFQQLVPPFEAAFHAHLAVAPRWETADRPPVHGVQELSSPDAGRSIVLHSGLPQDLCPPGGAGASVWHGPE
jgi:hypothetical protein